MYSLPHFKEKDPEAIIAFVKANPFAFLTGCDELQRPVVTQVPVFIDERDGKLFLSGHIMRNTDHHRAFVKNPNALAVFTGAHTYVSASWYTDQKQASTWNYMSVHGRGTLRFLDEQALVDILKRTTDHFENNSNSGANFKDIPESYVQQLAKAILAFEIEVTQLEHVFKLSQNKDEKSYHNIIDKLEGQGDEGKKIADEMKQRTEQVFNPHKS